MERIGGSSTLVRPVSGVVSIIAMLLFILVIPVYISLSVLAGCLYSLVPAILVTTPP